MCIICERESNHEIAADNTSLDVEALWFRFRTLSRNVRSLPFFLSTWRRLKQQARDSEESIPFGPVRPILDDRFAQAGAASGHYFHQDLLVARRIFENAPQRHIDVGSRVDGFVAHVATFREIEVIDVRPLSSDVPNLSFVCADMMSELPEELVESTDSLSCLHTIEHFGLGRYGDPVSYEGHVIGLRNLIRMVRPGGHFYLSTPIGREQRIEFNAHRVFSVPYLISKLEPDFTIDAFSYIDDDGRVHTNVDPLGPEANNSFDLRYGCGIFEMTKKSADASSRAA